MARDRPHTNHTPTHTNTSSKPQPGKKTATRRSTRQHTRKTHPHPHHCHKHTAHTPARAAPQTHATRETPHQTPLKRPPPQPADPSQERRGTAPRTLSQERRVATTTNTNGPPARSGGGPHPGPSARRGEGTPTQNPQPKARDHAQQTGGPQPGAAKAHPPPTPEDPSQEWRGATTETRTHSQGGRGTTRCHRRRSTTRGGYGHAHKQHGQEKRKAPPTTTTPPARDGKPTTTNHTAKRGVGQKGPTGEAGEGPNFRGLGAPPVTVSAAPEHTQ